ncbi:MAG: hypothetical protein EAZ53_13965 [Bacteroidetes bacterium]|nr:MAG: hypothetical protein EAZ53_13965 [Bacteroidota bacterium]
MKTEHKGNRNEIEGKIISGIYDVILLDGTKNFCYQPLYYRTFRYIQVKIEAYNEPLVIHDFYSKFTAYPLKENATFSSSDTTLKSIWNTSWRTARLSAIEHITGKAEIHLSSSKPAAPGMLESHYAPRKKMYIGDIDKVQF